MKAQTYKLGDLDIIIVAEQVTNDRDGNIRYDITLLAKNPSNEDFNLWNPKLPNYRRLKSGKYRSWNFGGIKAAIEDFYGELRLWYYDKDNA